MERMLLEFHILSPSSTFVLSLSLQMTLFDTNLKYVASE